MTNATWRRLLLQRYPFLFGRSEADEETVHGYAFVGDGWRDIVEVLAERISARAPRGAFRIDRIEEKYGTIVVGIQRAQAGLQSETLEAVDEAIALAEARSACTCQICGAEGALHDANGWLTTLCPEHARGVLVPVRPGWESLEFLMVVTGGHLRISRSRRYDRASDSFIDVEASALEEDE